MIKFRLVELDPDGYIKKEFYYSPSFSGNENSRKFKDAIDDCLFEYGYKLKFFDKKLRPQRVEIHINKDNKMWRYYLNAIREYKRRTICTFKGISYD